MSSLAYRPDIDGLRSIAVLSVVIYHAGYWWMPGGYVGVDVFFVISGYLITRLISEELRSTGRFRFGNFYLRRVRRLLPALLSTAIFAWLGAMLLLSPDEMKNFGSSLVAAVFSFSNIHFWSQTGYFDALASTKPLLNTWSLSVEEQFYLIWPALLFLLVPRLSNTVLIAGVIGVGILCVGLTHWLMANDPAAAFYLLPARVPELGIGALVALVRLPTLGPMLRHVLGIAGAVAIAAAIVLFDDTTTFPGISALLPCLGTAAIIAAGPGGIVAKVLQIAPMVWIGRISYSVYLIHWPLIVFHARLGEYHGVLLDGWALVLVSILLGWCQYALIEQRFRYVRPSSWPSSKFAIGAVVGALVVASPGAIAYWDKGHQWRIPENRSEHTNREWFKIEQRKYCRTFDPSMDRSLVTCQLARGGERDLFIWGDSHALHLVAGFAEHYPDHNIFVLYFGGCVAQSGFAGFVRDYRHPDTERCIAHNKAALEFLSQRPPSDVVISGAKRSKPVLIAPATSDILRDVRSAGHTVALVGDVIRPGISLNNCASVPAALVSDELISDACKSDTKIVTKELTYNRELATLIPEVLLSDDFQCPAGVCRFHDAQGTLLFRDYHHLNVPGAIHFGGHLKSRLPF